MKSKDRPVLRSRRSSEGNHSTSRKTIRVIAPATLLEGYSFDVEVSGQPITVTVPHGGVQKGEEFEFPLPQSALNESMEVIDKTDSSDAAHDDDLVLPPKPTTSSSDDETEQDTAALAPKGKWRNHLCACCDVLTQATFWMSFCCVPVLIAQLLTRLGLSWKGTKTTPEEASLTFNRIVMSFIGVLVVGNFPAIGFVASMLYTMGLLVWTGRNLRRTMRRRYNIPPSLHEHVDDLVCMMCCGCCSAVQMARHTHNDKEYPGSCCTTTGLDLDAPHIV